MQSHEVYKLDKDVNGLKEKLALSENKNKKLRLQCSLISKQSGPCKNYGQSRSILEDANIRSVLLNYLQGEELIQIWQVSKQLRPQMVSIVQFK